jgi:IS605 OrfB family transposase
VSSADQKADFDGLVACVTAWAAGEGLAVGWVVTGSGSALNGKRGKFLALLRDLAVTAIVAGHRGRFARSGSGYAEAALSVQGCRLMVMDPAGLDGDLVRVVTEVRRRKPSKRWERASARLRKAQGQVADLRRDSTHKLTTALAREYGTIVAEDLNIAGMVRNRRLARAISDAGWGEIRRQLSYKTKWNGGRLIVADRWFARMLIDGAG